MRVCCTHVCVWQPNVGLQWSSSFGDVTCKAKALQFCPHSVAHRGALVPLTGCKQCSTAALVELMTVL